MMLVVLLVPGGHRTPWFVAAVLSAIAASLSTVRGLVCRPVGALFIPWNQTRPRLCLWRTLIGAP